MSEGEMLQRLRERAMEAGAQLETMAEAAQEDGQDLSASRLRGKTQGVRLALSYIDEELRLLNVEAHPMTEHRTAEQGADAWCANPCRIEGGGRAATERWAAFPGKVPVCQACGADWEPVRRGECVRCGRDAGPIEADQ